MKLDKLTGRGTEYLFRHPVYKTIYFRRFTTKTGEVLRSLRTQDVVEAKARRDDLIRERQYPAKRPAQRETALELFDKWMQRKETIGAAANTMASMRASRKYFAIFFASMMPAEITAEWWESTYIPKVKKLTDNPARKFFNDRKWLIAFLRQIRDDGVLASLPTIRKIDPPTKVGKVYTDEEVGTLLNFAQNEDLYLAILMAVTMGMRRGEIFALSMDRIDAQKRTILLKAEDTKTKRSRSFAISRDCWPIISKRANSGAKWLFPSKADPSRHLHKDGYMTAWGNLKRTTMIKGRFHDFRHTFLTKAFKSPNVNPALVCYYAGLSMEVAEKVYLHFTADDTQVMENLITYSDSIRGIGDSSV